MGRMQRNKGARIEREIVHLHHAAAIPAEKVSRTGHSGPDLQIANEFSGEVKARKSGEGFATLERWLGVTDLLFLRRDRQKPMICMSWATYVQLLKTCVDLRDSPLGSETKAP